MDSGEVTFLLDSDYNIATRSGIHCSPLAHTTLGTLKQGAVRFSIGYFNTKDEIDKAVEALKKFQKINSMRFNNIEIKKGIFQNKNLNHLLFCIKKKRGP